MSEHSDNNNRAKQPKKIGTSGNTAKASQPSAKASQVASLNPKHWVLTRCGKVIFIAEHSVRDFSWEFADAHDPAIQQRCLQFAIDPAYFTMNHPKIENVDDAIATQIPFFYWTDPEKTTFSILNVAENDSKLMFLKSSEIDLLVGDENWTLIAAQHPAKISLTKRLEMFRAQSDKVKNNLYFLGEDNGWLIMLRMEPNRFHNSIKVEGMIFHNDPMLQLNTQQNWERHGNKSLHLAFSKRGAESHMQDSIWINVGWPNSTHCLRSHLKISDKMVNDNRFK